MNFLLQTSAPAGGGASMWIMLILIFACLFPVIRLIWNLGTRFGKKDK